MAKNKSNAVTSKLAIGLIFVLAVVYTAYHVLSLFTTEEISTIVSGVTTHSDTVEGRGYIFRDETLLYSENAGAVDYLVGDGEKVSKSQMIADVYEGNGKVTRSTVRSLDRQIALLEKSELGAEPLDLAALRQEANTTYYTLMRLLNSGEAGELEAQIENIMITLNRISLMTSGEGASGEGEIAQTLNQLYNTRANLLSGACVTEYSGESGYFYYYPDGYEKFFSVSALDTMDEQYFYSLENYLLGNGATLESNVYGKIAKSSGWYFAMALSEKDAAALQVGNNYRLVFPENNNTDLTMSLDRTLEASKHGSVICVFYCNKLPNNFKLDRAHNVQVDVSTVSGIYVPRSALAREDGIRGVYVLRGSIVHFRCIKIVYEGADYCLVSAEASDEGGFYALGTNELIITNGKNLFDGRILE